MNEFFYVFATCASALSVMAAWVCVLLWITGKEKETNNVIYKIAISLWGVFTLSFLIAGIATS